MKNRKNIGKRILSLALAFIMVQSLFPMSTMAAENCVCETDDPFVHATNCFAYVSQENPECYCVEKCSSTNIWCDICGFNYNNCKGGKDESVNYATSGRYITSLSVGYSTKLGSAGENAAKEYAQRNNHSLLDYELNANAGGDYIYMGYQRGDNYNNAITGIIFRKGANPPEYIDYGGARFYVLGGSNEYNNSGDGIVDLNKNAGGVYIYTYITRDLNYSNPISEINITNYSYTYGWETAGNTEGISCQDLNEDAGGDNIWLSFKRYSGSVTISMYYLDVFAGRQYDTYTYKVGHHGQEVVLYGSLNQGGASDIFALYHLKGYRLDDEPLPPTFSTTTSTELTSGRVFRGVYTHGVDLYYNANGGTGEPEIQSYENYVNAGSKQMTYQTITGTVSNKIPTNPSKCAFLGWNLGYDNTTVQYKPGDSIALNDFTILYAVWKDHSDKNGDNLCDDCSISLDKPAQVNGVYQILNKSQLIWFMQHVNNGNKNANAILLDDINMGGYNWTPMASTGLYYNTTNYNTPDAGYKGTFDGNSKVISNFKITTSATEEKSYGLFGTLSGTIKNLGLSNVTYSFPSGAKDMRAGGIVGQMLPNSVVENCYVRDSSITPGQYIAGGVAACNYGGTLRNCYTYKVSIKANERCGNLVSDTRGDISSTDRLGNVINCYTDASCVAGTQSGNPMVNSQAGIAVSRFTSGEVTWLLNNYANYSFWKQTIGTNDTPSFNGSAVYKVKKCDGKTDTYSNNSTNPQAHTYVNNICSVCGKVNPNAVAYASKNGKVIGYYTSLNEAIKAVSTATAADKAVVTLMKDQDDYITIQSGVFKLDLGDYELNSTNGSPLTVCQDAELSITGGHIITTTNYGIYNTGGKITITDCNIFGNTAALLNIGGEVSVYNSIFRSNVNGIQQESGKLTINDSTINSSGESIYMFGGELIVNSGKFTVVQVGCSIEIIDGNAEINGGIISGIDADISVSGGTLKLGLGANGTGAIFPNGISVYNTTLNNILDEDMAYWQGNKMIIPTDTQKTITGTDVIIKAKCNKHSNDILCSEPIICNDCGVKINPTTINHDKSVKFDANGFCENGCYEPAELNVDNYYEINNAGKLYWFAEKVLEDNTINAILTDDIVINENILDEYGQLKAGNYREWIPISHYSGELNGQNFVISGLYCNNYQGSAGLFCALNTNGIVCNLGIKDSYVSSTGTYIGGIVGWNQGEVKNCNSYVTINNVDYAGGICGANYGKISNCYSYANINANYSASGIVTSNYSSVENCYSFATLNSIDIASGISVYNDGRIDNCYSNSKIKVNGKVLTDNICNNNKYKITNCYYLVEEEIDNGDGTYGKTAEQFASGEVAYLLGEAFGQKIGTDACPVIGGDKVYYGYKDCTTTEKIYSNSPLYDSYEEIPEHTHEFADIDFDGRLTVRDATALAKALAGITTLTDCQHSVADVNNDGMISINDVTYIQMMLADLV